jgi:cytochrome c oxidase cbb3-type subunit 2
MTRAWLLILGALATLGFAVTALVVLPRVALIGVRAAPQLPPYSATQAVGRAVYTANGCVYCHSQQVRDPAFTTDIERGWGPRATVPADYVYDHPHLLGTMRTGPDLINVGQRLPDANWQLVHLYNPRSVTPWSIMPGFPFLFDLKPRAAVGPGDRVVPVTGVHAAPPGSVIVARPEALALVDYLLSLKRAYPVPAPVNDAAAGVMTRGVHTMP